MASQIEEIEQEYRDALLDLRENNKPVINALTMLANDKAEETPEGAAIVVRVIEAHLAQVHIDFDCLVVLAMRMAAILLPVVVVEQMFPLRCS